MFGHKFEDKEEILDSSFCIFKNLNEPILYYCHLHFESIIFVSDLVVKAIELEDRQIGGTGYVFALISIQIDTEVDLDFEQVANLQKVNVLDNNFAQGCRINSLKQVFVLNFSI